MNQHVEDFFAPCPRGLESVLATELHQLGACELDETQGGVGFRGPMSLCYEVNLESRIASRVLWRVFHGRYHNEEDIYRATLSLPWPRWFSVGHSIKVKVSAQHCPLKSLDFVTLRIKDAVCDAFVKKRKARPYVDTRAPDIQINAFVNDRDLTLYLDTSGEPLFKRGWRRVQGTAPIRENLAAGILHLAGWTENQVLLDPMCGSGTFLIEAAHLAGHIAPGIGRAFAFQKLNNYDDRFWKGLYERSRARQRETIPSKIYGYDRDPEAIRAARSNLKAVALENAISLQTGDVLTMTPPASSGVMVTNPPYGVRLGGRDELASWYPLLGDVLKQRFHGWEASIFSADARLPKLIRLSPSKKTPLFNGDLECRLYKFLLVQGGHRKSARSSGQGKLEKKG